MTTVGRSYDSRAARRTTQEKNEEMLALLTAFEERQELGQNELKKYLQNSRIIVLEEVYTSSRSVRVRWLKEKVRRRELGYLSINSDVRFLVSEGLLNVIKTESKTSNSYFISDKGWRLYEYLVKSVLGCWDSE